MRQKIVIGLLLLFCFAEVKPLLPILEYVVNYEYIADERCVNKDFKIVTCNGKCYLNFKLVEAEESDDSSKNTFSVELENIPMTTTSITEFRLQNAFDNKRLKSPNGAIRYWETIYVAPPTLPPIA